MIIYHGRAHPYTPVSMNRANALFSPKTMCGCVGEKFEALVGCIELLRLLVGGAEKDRKVWCCQNGGC